MLKKIATNLGTTAQYQAYQTSGKDHGKGCSETDILQHISQNGLCDDLQSAYRIWAAALKRRL